MPWATAVEVKGSFSCHVGGCQAGLCQGCLLQSAGQNRFSYIVSLFLRPTCVGPLVGYPLTRWCGGGSSQDHVPWTGPHRMGIGATSSGATGDTSGGATAQPKALRLNLNLDAVSRPLEKNACPHQPCFDVIKHICIYFLVFRKNVS